MARGGAGMVGGFAAVDAQEFPVVRKGCDQDRVRAYLGEVETAFRDLEQWTDEAANGWSKNSHGR